MFVDLLLLSSAKKYTKKNKVQIALLSVLSNPPTLPKKVRRRDSNSGYIRC